MGVFNNNYYDNNNSYSYQGYSSNDHQNTSSYYSYYGSYNSYSQNQSQNYDDLKTSSFYSESYEKPRKGKIREMLVPMIIVALISSVIGGAVVGAWFQFGAPAVVQNNQSSGNSQTGVQQIKQVEIVGSYESPATAIAEKVSPSIVGIKVTYWVSNYWFGAQQNSGSGSGIIIRSDGYILTNNHVIEDAISSGNEIAKGASIEVILPNQPDESYEAKVVGRDEKTDIAVLKIELSELPAAEIGNSDELKVGELAIAIGNPAGLEFMGSVTQGIISGLNREIQVGNGKTLKVIQTDAAINPGNSGGALVNSKGQVIGVNTVKISGSEYEGLGFAIPINTAMEIANSLISDGYVKGRPQLGVSIDTRFTEELAKSYNVPVGLLVADVSPLSAAYNAGIKAGDIIVEFNGVPVKTFSELENEKNKYKAGDTVTLRIYRIKNTNARGQYDGEYLDIQVTLGEDKGN
ncbi:peptidase S1 [Thermoclostridium stercorarium subsp. leptospartum DSM 9219]|jgi:serine protease Do|uniref:Peptidase S1 n=1 Tax=Thermoclostridium stercorarium subsp. leptospartum DSM 9219 TaxID=1346611 RepID=A0A1B1YJY8_THEST|nr:trypsin-like peptidase domain-containing protein [Thermoclostridium stercorarium]ANX01073.1 peptidase S1 [Thermoclostridium stercorarium subsp. leptospartum DSM 9219]